MVSFQAPTTSLNGNCSSSKKRKWEDLEPQLQQHTTEAVFLEKRKSSINEANKNNPKSIFDIDLHLESPLPPEWQRCLDIQSGQIHFYNTRTHKRTSRDPRNTSTNQEPTSPVHDQMSLELELNLPCDHSQRKNHPTNYNATKANSGSSATGFDDFFKLGSSTNKRDGGNYNDCNKQDEMVATVCTNCNMLVMLCKSSPTCPNCKFLHPQDQNPRKLLQPRLSLLC